MERAWLWVVVVVLGLVFSASAQMLECMSCQDIKQKSSGSFFDLPDFETDAYCGSPDFFHMPDTTTCDDGESCSAMRGSADVSIPLVGDVTYQVTWRGCAPYTPDGCVTANNEALGILSDLMGHTVNSMDGTICFCNTPICMADTCGDGYVSIGHYCFVWWTALLTVLIAIPIVTCCFCCCCCCSCCRRKPAPGAIILHQPSTDHVVLVNAPTPMAGTQFA